MSFDFSVIEYAFPLFVAGAVSTLTYCLAALVVGILFGTIVALGLLSHRRIPRYLCMAFVEPFRNTPFLVQAFLVYFGLAQLGLRLSAPVAGMLVLCVYSSALFAEAIRGGIQSVPKGQLEAARAVGMPYLIGMRRVVFPQMIGYMLPVTTNLCILLIKDSAALSIITVPELAMSAQRVVGETFRPVETYLFVALVYWLLITGMTRMFVLLQKVYLSNRLKNSAKFSVRQRTRA